MKVLTNQAQRKFIAAVLSIAMILSCLTTELVFAASGDGAVGAAEAPQLEPLPDGAIDVGAITAKSGNKQANTIIVTEKNGAKRTVADTIQNGGIWYLGDYDISEIKKIEVRSAFVPGTLGELPTLKFGYYKIEGDETVDTAYIDGKSLTIRNDNRILASVYGSTKPTSGDRDGKYYSGAVFTIDKEKVTVDAAGYDYYPGGTAEILEKDPTIANKYTKPLTSPNINGKVHLFVYGTANKCRLTIDYIKIYGLNDPDPAEYFGKGTFDSGWYGEDSAKQGVIRFLQQFVGQEKGTVTSYGFYFVDSQGGIEKAKISETGKLTDEGIYADLYGIGSGKTDTYLAKAFVTIDGKTYWSDKIYGRVSDWSNENKLESYSAPQQ